jgi:hypothetical protein
MGIPGSEAEATSGDFVCGDDEDDIEDAGIGYDKDGRAGKHRAISFGRSPTLSILPCFLGVNWNSPVVTSYIYCSTTEFKIIQNSARTTECLVSLGKEIDGSGVQSAVRPSPRSSWFVQPVLSFSVSLDWPHRCTRRCRA